MPIQVLSWLRETAKLTLGYLGVGLCFAVAGIAWSLFRMGGLTASIAISVALILGFVGALLFWHRCERLILETVAVPRISSGLALALSDITDKSWADLYVERAEGPQGRWVVKNHPSIVQDSKRNALKPATTGVAYAGLSRNSG